MFQQVSMPKFFLHYITSTGSYIAPIVLKKSQNISAHHSHINSFNVHYVFCTMFHSISHFTRKQLRLKWMDIPTTSHPEWWRCVRNWSTTHFVRHYCDNDTSTCVERGNIQNPHSITRSILLISKQREWLVWADINTHIHEEQSVFVSIMEMRLVICH